MRRLGLVSAVLLLLAGGTAAAGEPHDVGLTANEVGTLHVEARLGKQVGTEFLLDTGSAYVVLTDATRRSLAAEGALTPVRQLRAVMANNSTARAQVYRVTSLRFADGCEVRNFEAVALPGARKNILGLSALRAVAPFTVDVTPLRLRLNCTPPADVVAWSGAPTAAH